MSPSIDKETFIHDHQAMTLPAGIEIALIAAAVFYCTLVLALAFGMGRLGFPAQVRRPFVSVIVAARNEERTIEDLIRHLLAQDYPTYEVIIINDRSTDRTGQIISGYQALDPRIRKLDVLTASTSMPAKKHALSKGIASSAGEILCFTDADCAPPPQWISSLVSAFDQDVGLAAGYSPYVSDEQSPPPSLFQRILHSFIRYEEFKGATWSAGSIALKRAWLCTGRSLAYRRIVFDEVGGFEEIKHSVSGDDDLFLQLVQRTTRWQIRYVAAPESFVPTLPPRNFREFIGQRTRHFSAGKYFPPGMKAFFLGFHSSNLVLVVSCIEGIISGRPWHALLPFGAKCVVDIVVFIRAARVFRHTEFAATFLGHELLYVLYNTFVGPLGFVGRFRWKQEATI
jgi:cellulose synthase/poly-beta-1,6-N-acetylglucosamine synthase-like glycosyltransferase